MLLGAVVVVAAEELEEEGWVDMVSPRQDGL